MLGEERTVANHCVPIRALVLDHAFMPGLYGYVSYLPGAANLLPQGVMLVAEYTAKPQ